MAKKKKKIKKKVKKKTTKVVSKKKVKKKKKVKGEISLEEVDRTIHTFAEPISERFSMAEFEEALAGVEKRKKKKLYEHVAEQCFKSDKVLIQVMKKFLPDLRSLDLKNAGGETTMTDAQAMKIRELLLSRMGAE
ncbi:hypothetical protein KAR91_32385 [Candidatus Pacearchaeota archaeon]|nr:hypothetical protein [Candidatus Pacearchaeota archaeon]